MARYLNHLTGLDGIATMSLCRYTETIYLNHLTGLDGIETGLLSTVRYPILGKNHLTGLDGIETLMVVIC